MPEPWILLFQCPTKGAVEVHMYFFCCQYLRLPTVMVSVYNGPHQVKGFVVWLYISCWFFLQRFPHSFLSYLLTFIIISLSLSLSLLPNPSLFLSQLTCGLTRPSMQQILMRTHSTLSEPRECVRHLSSRCSFIRHSHLAKHPFQNSSTKAFGCNFSIGPRPTSNFSHRTGLIWFSCQCKCLQNHSKWNGLTHCLHSAEIEQELLHDVAKDVIMEAKPIVVIVIPFLRAWNFLCICSWSGTVKILSTIFLL